MCATLLKSLRRPIRPGTDAQQIGGKTGKFRNPPEKTFRRFLRYSSALFGRACLPLRSGCIVAQAAPCGFCSSGYSGAASVREILTGDVWGRRDDEYQDVIDNPEYKPMLVIAVIKPHNPSLEAPVLTGRRLSFNPRR